MAPRFRQNMTLVALTSTVFWLGCSTSDGTTEADNANNNAACAEIASTCLERNQGCTVSDGEAACAACEKGEYATGEFAECRALPGTPLTHDFGVQSLDPAQEIGSLCQTWVLDNDEPLYINAVELENDGYYHHSNWFFVPEDHEGWTTEPWLNCYAEGFSEIAAALAGGVIYAQSTQVQFELQKFQDGAVIKIPARSRIIGATHLLNYTPDSVSTGLRMTLHALDTDEIKTKLTPAQLILRSRYHRRLDPPLEPPATSSRAPKLFKASGYEDSLHLTALSCARWSFVLIGYNDGMKLVEHGGCGRAAGYVFDPPVDQPQGWSFTVGSTIRVTKS